MSPTHFCDSGNAEIVSIAEQIMQGKCDVIEKSLLAKRWIEENVQFRYDDLQVPASETLKKRRGQCIQMANLQVALLRAVGVPAGYGLVEVTKKIFRCLIPSESYVKLAQSTTHIYCVVYSVEQKKFLNFDSTVGDAQSVDFREYTSEGEAIFKGKYLRSGVSIKPNIDYLMEDFPEWFSAECQNFANNFLEKLEKEKK